MRLDLDNALVHNFPCLFRLHRASTDGPREPISFGFEIEDGWEPIVRRLAKKLEPIARDSDLRAVQVKEKNGSLRFYVEYGALPADVLGNVLAAIEEAREQSTRTCELCGADGVLRGERRVQTLCTPCAGRLADQDSATPSVKPPSQRIKPTEDFDARYKPLLARRIPREQIVLGRAYVIHARNGGVGVADEDDGSLGYCLHREKGGDHFLFTEFDWDNGPPFGTAIPLKLIEAEPPTDDDELLAWLEEQAEAHRAEIDAAWEVILGIPRGRFSSWKDRK